MSDWNTPVSNSEGAGSYELPPAGSHPAVCVGLVDLGTHERTYNGKTDEVHKVLFVWELTAECQSDGQTFLVTRDFSWTLKSNKSKLRGFLEGWNGRAFADGENIDLAAFVGQSCVVSISEGVSGSGKKFVEVASCSKPMRGLAVPPASVQPIVFSLKSAHSCAGDPPIPNRVPPLYGRKIADEIKASKEWRALPPY